MRLLCILVVLASVHSSQAWAPRSSFSQAARSTFVRTRERRNLGATALVVRRAGPSSEGGGFGELLPLGKISTVLSTLSPRGAEAQGAAGQWSCDAATGAWVLEPRSLPVCVVHFLGGAGFGTYPRVAYAELLERLSLACGGGVAVVCTPYDVALDHGALATTARTDFDAVRTARTEAGVWPEGLRTARLGHSLGGKLHVLNLADHNYPPGDVVGLVAFNNFALEDSVGAALKQVEEFTGSETGLGESGIGEQLAGFASIFLKSSGLDFAPSRDDTKQLLAASANGRQVTAFRFPGDALDSSPDLQACAGSRVVFVEPPEGSAPATHLAPVFVAVAAGDVAARAEDFGAPNLEDLGFDSMAGFSFGDAVALDALVRALTTWLMGSPPSSSGRQLSPPRA